MKFRCCVTDCGSFYSNHSKNNIKVSFFTIPDDRKLQWLINIGKPELLDGSLRNVRICALHFEDCFFKNKSRNRLFNNAVPTLLLGDSSKQMNIQSEPKNMELQPFKKLGELTVYNIKIEESDDSNHMLNENMTNSLTKNDELFQLEPEQSILTSCGGAIKVEKIEFDTSEIKTEADETTYKQSQNPGDETMHFDNIVKVEETQIYEGTEHNSRNTMPNNIQSQSAKVKRRSQKSVANATISLKKLNATQITENSSSKQQRSPRKPKSMIELQVRQRQQLAHQLSIYRLEKNLKLKELELMKLKSKLKIQPYPNKNMVDKIIRQNQTLQIIYK